MVANASPTGRFEPPAPSSRDEKLSAISRQLSAKPAGSPVARHPTFDGLKADR
jgi:hypothetical protein